MSTLREACRHYYSDILRADDDDDADGSGDYWCRIDDDLWWWTVPFDIDDAWLMMTMMTTVRK